MEILTLENTKTEVGYERALIDAQVDPDCELWKFGWPGKEVGGGGSFGNTGSQSIQVDAE